MHKTDEYSIFPLDTSPQKPGQFPLPDNLPPHLEISTRLLKRTFENRHNNPFSDTNRSSSINFVHVNDRSLYIVDRRMAVEGECPTPCNKGGEIIRKAKCLREMSRGSEMSGSQTD